MAARGRNQGTGRVGWSAPRSRSRSRSVSGLVSAGPRGGGGSCNDDDVGVDVDDDGADEVTEAAVQSALAANAAW